MQINEASLFIMYTLTEEEKISGCILSTEQAAVIQNDIALAAHGQASLKYDPLNPVEFAQKQASLAGTIVALRTLLDRSEAKKAELREMQVANASHQEQYQEPENPHANIINELFPKG